MNSIKSPSKSTTRKSKKEALFSQREEWKNLWQKCLRELAEIDVNEEEIDLFLDRDAISEQEKRLQEASKSLRDQKLKLWPEDVVVEKLNKCHALVHTDSTYYLTEKVNPQYPDQIDFSLETRSSFLNRYESNLTEDDYGEIKTLAQIWLKNPNQRRYEDGIVFDPTRTGHYERRYNLWRGFSVKPAPGKCELFKAHIREIICAGNEEHYDYVWRWLAHLVQHPDKKSTALMLMGSQGTGKGVFVKAIGHLFGPHFTHVDNLQHVVGKFNGHLKNSVLVFCDEALWGGDKRDIGRVKAMITEETAVIEQKGRDAFTVPNFRHFIFASNEHWPLHIDKDDRRIMVLKISEARKEDNKYFQSINKELKNGGYEALLYELLNVDLSYDDVRAMPKNSSAFSVKMLSSSSSERYIYEALLLQSMDIGNAASQEGWRERIPTNAFYADYTAWCDKQGLNREDQRQFAAKLYHLIPSAKKIYAGTTTRTYTLLMPPIEVARKEFQKCYKTNAEIWSEDCL